MCENDKDKLTPEPKPSQKPSKENFSDGREANKHEKPPKPQKEE